MSFDPEVLRQLQKAREPKPKKEKKPIAKVSKKKAAQQAEEMAERGGRDTLKEEWFKRQRKTLTGTCQCGCGRPSSKNDDTYFRSSICHVFPKSKFKSVMYHNDNRVERAFFGGCHSNMDDRSISLWPNMADWEDIKERFHVLAPLLTDEERATKFYYFLEKLVYEN